MWYLRTRAHIDARAHTHTDRHIQTQTDARDDSQRLVQTTSIRGTCKRLEEILRDVASQYQCSSALGRGRGGMEYGRGGTVGSEKLLRYDAFLEGLGGCGDWGDEGGAADGREEGGGGGAAAAGHSSSSRGHGDPLCARDFVELHSLQAVQVGIPKEPCTRALRHAKRGPLTHAHISTTARPAGSSPGITFVTVGMSS